MAKPSNSVILIYITVAVLFLFLLSFSPTRPHRPNRRLKLRPVTTGGRGVAGGEVDPTAARASASADHRDARHSIAFDPLIAEIERSREDREWERANYHLEPPAPGEEQPEWEDFMDAEGYINDEERFNITSRIVLLFPKIDVAPADGLVSVDELTEWNLQQAEKDVLHRTRRDLELHDKNHDGFISFQEYEPPSWAIRSNGDEKVGWWKEDHFNASDVDGDGLLNLTEFNDFLHPADTSNPKLIHWLCREEIRGKDIDKDGKLNFEEFFNGLFDLIRNHDERHNLTYESDTSREASAKKLFSRLDKDNDGFLSADELIPIIGDVHLSERYYAKQQADYILNQADIDKDGRLSLTEMIESPYVFYSAIFSDDDDYNYHDEFR